jgi:hypothetical protein
MKRNYALAQRRGHRVPAGMAKLTLFDDGTPHTLDAVADDCGVRVPVTALTAATGWTLKPEGLCRDAVCVPVRDRAALVRDDGVDLAAFAALLDRPLAVDVAEGVAALGASAAERGAQLASLDAPDFALPDLAGRLHGLADLRGRKALLLAWAGW